MEGFQTYNQFKKNVKSIHQLYDLSYHLLVVEKKRLKKEIHKISKGSKKTFLTSIGEVDHDIPSLYNRLNKKYPSQIRRLYLINLVTVLEVYLTDVIREIFYRDVSPFKTDKTITYQKNYLLNTHSIIEVKENIIEKEIRQLTSGGLNFIVKYYKQNFDVELNNLGISFRAIEEIHIRRHISVHKNGSVDSAYAKKYPEFGLQEGDNLNIEHEYIIDAIKLVKSFGSKVDKEIKKLFPINSRKQKNIEGPALYNPEQLSVMLEIGIKNKNFSYEEYFQTLEVKGQKLNDMIVQFSESDKKVFLFLNGDQRTITRFYNPIKNHSDMRLIRTVKLKTSDDS